jgi:hypothetical protein
MTLIRHIATTLNGDNVAVAEVDTSVYVWNLANNSEITQFQTILDNGGNRLAITTDGRNCIAGAYHIHGIASYCVANRTEEWSRSDLKKVQRIRVSLDDERVFCSFEGKSFQILNRKDGTTIAALRGINGLRESPYDPVSVVDRKNRDFAIRSQNGKTIANVPRTTFAALDLSFAPHRFCISESGGPVRCISVGDGIEIWRFAPPSGYHILKLAYCESTASFHGIIWGYEEGGACQLIRWDAATGAMQPVVELGARAKYGFCQRGSRLIATDGTIWDVATGDIIRTLPFPTDDE